MNKSEWQDFCSNLSRANERFERAVQELDVLELLSIRRLPEARFGRTSLEDHVDLFFYHNKKRLVRPFLREIKNNPNPQTRQMMRRELKNFYGPASRYSSSLDQDLYQYRKGLVRLLLQELENRSNPCRQMVVSELPECIVNNPNLGQNIYHSDLCELVDWLKHKDTFVLIVVCRLILDARSLPPSLAEINKKAAKVLIKALEQGNRLEHQFVGVLDIGRIRKKALGILGIKPESKPLVIRLARQEPMY
ncbi:MAG: hypothetical protein WBG70_21670 [Spirulinaceae cyanobacterium]